MINNTHIWLALKIIQEQDDKIPLISNDSRIPDLVKTRSDSQSSKQSLNDFKRYLNYDIFWFSHYESFQSFKNENFALPKLVGGKSISTSALRDSVKNLMFGKSK
jgi:hypothetical protein